MFKIWWWLPEDYFTPEHLRLKRCQREGLLPIHRRGGWVLIADLAPAWQCIYSSILIKWLTGAFIHCYQSIHPNINSLNKQLQSILYCNLKNAWSSAKSWATALTHWIWHIYVFSKPRSNYYRHENVIPLVLHTRGLYTRLIPSAEMGFGHQGCSCRWGRWGRHSLPKTLPCTIKCNERPDRGHSIRSYGTSNQRP